MSILRNSININGITLEKDIPKVNNGQTIIYSDTEKFIIPNDYPRAKSLYEISVEIEVISKRIIDTNIGKIILIDGVRKYNILYIEEGEANKGKFFDFKMPYNTFVEIPKGINEINKIEIHIIDAYFELLSNIDIYSYNLYLINIFYNNHENSKKIIIDNENIKDGIGSNNKNEDEIASTNIIYNKENNLKDSSNKNNKIEFIDIDEEYL